MVKAQAGCDTIFLKNGTKFLGIVSEVSNDFVTIKYCEKNEFPTVTVKVADCRDKTYNIIMALLSKERKKERKKLFCTYN